MSDPISESSVLSNIKHWGAKNKQTGHVLLTSFPTHQRKHHMTNIKLNDETKMELCPFWRNRKITTNCPGAESTSRPNMKHMMIPYDHGRLWEATNRRKQKQQRWGRGHTQWERERNQGLSLALSAHIYTADGPSLCQSAPSYGSLHTMTSYTIALVVLYELHDCVCDCVCVGLSVSIIQLTHDCSPLCCSEVSQWWLTRF